MSYPTSLTWVRSALRRARRTPERARIGPIRIELQHPVVELSRGRRQLGQAVEVADVLPGLFDDSRVVVVLGLLVSGDHRARLERLDREARERRQQIGRAHV